MALLSYCPRSRADESVLLAADSRPPTSTNEITNHQVNLLARTTQTERKNILILGATVQRQISNIRWVVKGPIKFCQNIATAILTSAPDAS